MCVCVWCLHDTYSHDSVGVWLLEAQQSLFITVIQRQFKTKIHQRYSLPPHRTSQPYIA